MENSDLNQVYEQIEETLQTYGYFFTVTNKMQAESDKEIEAMTMRQLFLLVGLEAFGDYDPSLQELAYIFGSSYQNVKRMALQLEEDGYLSIRKDSKDRRKIRLKLNRANYDKLMEDTRADVDTFFGKVFRGISAEELQNVSRILAKINSNLDDVDAVEEN